MHTYLIPIIDYLGIIIYIITDDASLIIVIIVLKRLFATPFSTNLHYDTILSRSPLNFTLEK